MKSNRKRTRKRTINSKRYTRRRNRTNTNKSRRYKTNHRVKRRRRKLMKGGELDSKTQLLTSTDYIDQPYSFSLPLDDNVKLNGIKWVDPPHNEPRDVVMATSADRFTWYHRDSLFDKTFTLGTIFKDQLTKCQQFNKSKGRISCILKVTEVEGGMCSQGYLTKLEHPDWKLALGDAGNSGRICGGCGITSDPENPIIEKLHPNHTTQDEDICSNWMMAQYGSPIYNGRNNPEQQRVFKELYDTIGWGLPVDNFNYETYQGLDYRQASPSAYADAWVVRDVMFCNKVHQGYIQNRKNERQKAYRYDYKIGCCGDDKTYSATLIFIAAPYIAKETSHITHKRTITPDASMSKTHNDVMFKLGKKGGNSKQKGYTYFREGVKYCIRGFIHSCIKERIDCVLVPLAGCGIYCGQYCDYIINDFITIVQEVLDEEIGTLGGQKICAKDLLCEVIIPRQA